MRLSRFKFRAIALGLLFILLLALCGCGSNSEIEELKAQIAELQEQIEDFQNKLPSDLKIYKQGETAPLYKNNSIYAEVTFVGWDNNRQIEVFTVKNISPIPFRLGEIAFCGVSYSQDDYTEYFTRGSWGIVIDPNESVEYCPPHLSPTSYQYIAVGSNIEEKSCLKNIYFEL